MAKGVGMAQGGYRLGLYEKSMPGTLTLAQKLAECGAAGFDFLELSIDETDEKLARLDWDEGEIKSLWDAQREAGVPIRSICLSGHRRFPLGHPDEGVRKKSLSIMEKGVLLAAQLGVRIIQIAGYDVYYEEASEATRRFFAENLARSVEYAAREGVVLAFETMETEFINTVGKAMEWVEEISSPYLQVYPDIGNITNAAVQYGTDVLGDLSRGRGHVVGMHLKETLPGVFRELPYGAGHVDFGAAVEKALEMGVRYYVGEFWHTGEENWREILRSNHDFLHRLFGE